MYEQIDLKKVDQIQLHVANNSEIVDKIVEDIIKPYCKDLDAYVKFIADCLKDGNNPPSNSELEDFSMNLATYIYFAGGLCEQLGVRDDISRAVYKETYNTSRNAQNGGTVADKDTIAELSCQHEQLVSVCYTRAYKTMKAKVDNAQELLGSVKKVLSHRMQEMELTRIAPNTSRSNSF